MNRVNAIKGARKKVISARQGDVERKQAIRRARSEILSKLEPSLMPLDATVRVCHFHPSLFPARAFRFQAKTTRAHQHHNKWNRTTFERESRPGAEKNVRAHKKPGASFRDNERIASINHLCEKKVNPFQRG